MYLSSLALLLLLIPAARAVAIPTQNSDLSTSDNELVVAAVVDTVLIDREASPDGAVDGKYSLVVPAIAPTIENEIPSLGDTVKGGTEEVTGTLDGVIL
ncbi:hypothetical protein V491_06503, partial [Pseudogymnoascus sp. VKM F-3775]